MSVSAAELSAVPVYIEFCDAARALRDAELAIRAAQERYRKAFDALNRAVAPVPKDEAP